MLILVLLGMYFDAVGKFVASQTLLFRLALWNMKISHDEIPSYTVHKLVCSLKIGNISFHNLKFRRIDGMTSTFVILLLGVT